jgi:two-component system nitrogen regulation response regulator GlnG
VTRQVIINSRGLPRLQATPRIEQELSSSVTPLRQRMPSPTPHQAKESSPAQEQTSTRRKPSEVSDQELLAALRGTSWDLKAAADRLGIPRPSLYMLIERSPSLRTAGDLSPQEITRCFQECNGDLDAMVRQLEVSKRGLQRRVRELGLGGDPE